MFLLAVQVERLNALLWRTLVVLHASYSKSLGKAYTVLKTEWTRILKLVLGTDSEKLLYVCAVMCIL